MTETIITSRRHPFVARCRDAADGHAADVLLEGPHLVADAIDAGTALPLILVAEGAAARPDVAAVVARAAQRGLPLHWVTPSVLDAASPTRTPVGVVALATLALAEVDQLWAHRQPLVTMAVGVQDPGNVGTLVRSSEAAGATGVLAAGSTAHPFGWRALRGAMGSSLRLPVARTADTDPAVRAALAHGLRVVALTGDGDVTLHDADLGGPLVVCAGAEGGGLPEAVLALASLRLRIPMQRQVESLNVGVAASLVLFEVMRQRGGGDRGSRIADRGSRIGDRGSRGGDRESGAGSRES